MTLIVKVCMCVCVCCVLVLLDSELGHFYTLRSLCLVLDTSKSKSMGLELCLREVNIEIT